MQFLHIQSAGTAAAMVHRVGRHIFKVSLVRLHKDQMKIIAVFFIQNWHFKPIYKYFRFRQTGHAGACAFSN